MKSTITYHKLVRDKIPEIIETSGKTCVTEILSDEEYLRMVDAKLDEELAEYHKDQNIEELADLLEVIYAAAKARGYSVEQLEAVRAEKAAKRGGFEKKILLKEVWEGNDMDLQRAKELLASLADGVDPLTGEVLPEESVCNKAEIVRAFHCILTALPSKPKRKQPENAGKPWTAEDDAALCRMYDAGSTKKEICAFFKRSEGGIASRLVRLGKISARDEFNGWR